MRVHACCAQIFFYLCVVDIYFHYRWFELYDDPDTGTSYYAFKGEYWNAKLNNDYSSCPDIY